MIICNVIRHTEIEVDGEPVSCFNVEKSTKAVTEYMINHMEDILDFEAYNVKTNKINSSRISQIDKIELGAPFIIYNANIEEQPEILYYPIINTDKNEVIYLIASMRIDDEYVYNIMDYLIDPLNDMNYTHEKCVIYQCGINIYIENGNKIMNTYEYYNNTSDKTIFSSAEADFIELSFDEKGEKIAERMENLTSCQLKTDYTEKEILGMKIYGILELRVPVGQYGYNMCWAAATATVINYHQSLTVDPYTICSRLSVGYNNGGTIYDEQAALNLYGIKYNIIRTRSMYFSEIAMNIDNYHPIIANGNTSATNPSGYIGHAVTIYGYNLTSDTIYAWDSSLNSGRGGAILAKYENNYFSCGDSQTIYYWVSSLSYS